MRRILIPFHHADLPWARVAAETALNGGADEVVALAADEDVVPVGSFAAGIRVLTASDVGISQERVAITAAAHGTPVTPRVIVAEAIDALGGDDDVTLVLAPTVRVVAPLESLWAALDAHAVVLVSNILDPSHDVVPQRRMGLEKRAPSAPTDVLATLTLGPVSASVIGVHPSRGRAVLDRWPGRMGAVSHYDAVAPGRFDGWLTGLAVTPGVHVLRDPGVGVAWFNLHEREVVAGEDGIRVNGAPLTLMELRGHDPRRPNVLCPQTSIGFVSETPALIGELHAHSRALREAGAALDRGQGMLAEHLHHQGRWATLPNGDQMVAPMRNLYRTMVAEGELTRSPYTPEGQAEMIAAFRGPGPRGKPAGVNRFVWSLWVDREELRTAYPKLEGGDGPGLIGWVWEYGRRELLPESVMPDFAERFAAGDVIINDSSLAPAKSRMSAHRGGQIDGVNVAGFFSAQLGLGESVRQLVHALRVRDIDVVPVQGRVIPSGRGESDFGYVTPDQAEHPVTILMLNGDSIPLFAEDVGEDFFRDRYTIGFYWWEVDPYPADAWNPALEYVDELWAGTEFVGDILRRGQGVDVPVTVVRVPVADPPPVTCDRAHFDLPEDATLFGFVYDYESSGQRKNPLGLVQAYTKAFGPDDGCHLVLKCLGSIHRPDDHEEVLVAAAGRDDITIIDRYLSTAEKDSLVGLCDCYVSPHRSEGFGYTLAEAMAYGKPVICTDYGGVQDFATEETVLLVKATPSLTGPFAIPYPPDSTWADPDLDDLAEKMRWVHEHPDAAAALGRRASEVIRATHSYQAAGASMEARLKEIYEEIDQRARVSSPAPARDTTRRRRAFSTALHAPVIGRGLRRARGAWWTLMDRAVASRTEATVEELREVQAAVLGADRELEKLRQELQGARHLAADQATRLNALERGLGHVGGAVEGVHGAVDLTRADVAAVADAQRTLAGDLARHEERHSPVPYGVVESGMQIVEAPGYGRVLHQTFNGNADQGYASILDCFRGDWDRVREMAEPYGELLAEHGPVLDLGCGRGELLDVLRAHEIEARGVDLAPELVERARSRGLDAERGDALEIVRSLEPGSLGAITALHVIEHLEPAVLEELLRACHAALRPDGLLALETVNVHDMLGAAGFWLDITHKRPILPEALLALTGAAGFAEGWIFAPGGTGDWEVDRSSVPRYTVVARR